MIRTISDCTCTRVRYNEFPDLLFGTTANGQEYFDATHFIMKKGMSRNIMYDNLKCFYSLEKGTVRSL